MLAASLQKAFSAEHRGTVLVVLLVVLDEVIDDVEDEVVDDVDVDVDVVVFVYVEVEVLVELVELVDVKVEALDVVVVDEVDSVVVVVGGSSPPRHLHHTFPHLHQPGGIVGLAFAVQKGSCAAGFTPLVLLSTEPSDVAWSPVSVLPGVLLAFVFDRVQPLSMCCWLWLAEPFVALMVLPLVCFWCVQLLPPFVSVALVVLVVFVTFESGACLRSPSN